MKKIMFLPVQVISLLAIFHFIPLYPCKKVLIHDFGVLCPHGYPVYLPNLQTCVKASKIGNPCRYDEQCEYHTEYSTCKGLCKCKNNFIKIHGPSKQIFCKPKADLEDNCSFSEQCEEVNEHSWCKNGTCKCYYHIDPAGKCTYAEKSDAYKIPKWMLVAIIFAIVVLVLILAHDSIKKCICKLKFNSELNKSSSTENKSNITMDSIEVKKDDNIESLSDHNNDEEELIDTKKRQNTEE